MGSRAVCCVHRHLPLMDVNIPSSAQTSSPSFLPRFASLLLSIYTPYTAPTPCTFLTSNVACFYLVEIDLCLRSSVWFSRSSLNVLQRPSTSFIPCLPSCWPGSASSEPFCGIVDNQSAPLISTHLQLAPDVAPYLAPISPPVRRSIRTRFLRPNAYAASLLVCAASARTRPDDGVRQWPTVISFRSPRIRPARPSTAPSSVFRHLGTTDVLPHARPVAFPPAHPEPPWTAESGLLSLSGA